MAGIQLLASGILTVTVVFMAGRHRLTSVIQLYVLQADIDWLPVYLLWQLYVYLADIDCHPWYSCMYARQTLIGIRYTYCDSCMYGWQTLIDIRDTLVCMPGRRRLTSVIQLYVWQADMNCHPLYLLWQLYVWQADIDWHPWYSCMYGRQTSIDIRDTIVCIAGRHWLASGIPTVTVVCVVCMAGRHWLAPGITTVTVVCMAGRHWLTSVVCMAGRHRLTPVIQLYVCLLYTSRCV